MFYGLHDNGTGNGTHRTGTYPYWWLTPQSTYFPRDETGLVCLPTQLERRYTATLLVMVNVIKGGGRATPTLTSQGKFYPHD